ncbi:N-acetylmuramoyl-L-alanine amidase XlyA [Lactobacillus helveticus]|uniref:SAG1386/EF1546 family surface-associated protein n=1 Tax=Lactobacillus helveticus TaxID=1587 RepID=UPI001564B1B2|nr:SAG1386/EF1546 family surface-associated protein [Lactobacillus helveticus]MCO0806881.1 LysM peptidoglycan-binding domain-containing protein [Lactobacillus helveticus]NRO75360.1 N-acetylmuramoyl-L-alanine amidase XlyA [Lactobacillus helveticus]
MDKKSTGPYQHYERPTEKRSSQDKQPGGSARWIAVIVILVVILIALIPVVHRLSSGNSEKAEEVQTVKKVSSKKSSKAIKSSNKAKKTSSSAKKNSVKTSSSSSQESKPKTYLVKDGDTLTNIAEKNGMTVDQLSRLNGLEDTSNINVGQTLKLR